LAFTHQFDRGVGTVVRSDAAAIAHLFAVLDRVDDDAITKLLDTVLAIPVDELAQAANSLSRMRPSLMRRLAKLASQPGLARLLR
jgi:hypothetical protein